MDFEKQMILFIYLLFMLVVIITITSLYFVYLTLLGHELFYLLAGICGLWVSYEIMTWRLV